MIVWQFEQNFSNIKVCTINGTPIMNEKIYLPPVGIDPGLLD